MLEKKILRTAAQIKVLIHLASLIFKEPGTTLFI